MKITVYVSWEYEEVVASKEKAIEKMKSDEVGCCLTFEEYLEDTLELSAVDCFNLSDEKRILVKESYEKFLQEEFNRLWEKREIEL